MKITENIENGVIVSVTVADDDHEWTLTDETANTTANDGIVLAAFYCPSTLPEDAMRAFRDWLARRYP